MNRRLAGDVARLLLALSIPVVILVATGWSLMYLIERVQQGVCA